VIGRLLASLVVGALVLGGGAGAGFGEPRPAERIMPVDVLPLAAGSLVLPEPPPTVGPLRKVDVERPAPPAATGTSPVSVSSPARPESPDRADLLKPAEGLSDTRSKP
jgi:hypothetical protein